MDGHLGNTMMGGTLKLLTCAVCPNLRPHSIHWNLSSVEWYLLLWNRSWSLSLKVWPQSVQTLGGSTIPSWTFLMCAFRSYFLVNRLGHWGGIQFILRHRLVISQPLIWPVEWSHALLFLLMKVVIDKPVPFCWRTPRTRCIHSEHPEFLHEPSLCAK